MAIAPTRFSRVSIGFADSVRSLADVDAADTGTVFSVTGPTAFSAGDFTLSGTGSDLSVGGTMWIGGASTLNSTLTASGVGTFGGIRSTSAVTIAGTSTLSVGGTLFADGAATFNSTLTAAGNVTATSGLFVGTATAINELVAISSATAAVSLGAIAPLESSSVVTVGLSGVTRGDTVILTLDSIYQIVAANRDVLWHCSSGSTTGELNVWGVNSTLTSVTPTAATVVRLTRINHPSYL